MAKALAPGRVVARPSASVGLAGQGVTQPAASDSVKLGIVSASTPMTCTLGRSDLDRQRNARDQPRPANRRDHRVEIGNLVEQFQADRPLAGDDGRIVKAVDVGHALFSGDRVGLRFWPRRSCCRGGRRSRPYRRQVATLISGANRGITTVTGMPKSRPWQASAKA